MKIDIEFNSGAQLPMDAIPELARQAEAHGFDCAWGGEANNKDPTVMLSAMFIVFGSVLSTNNCSRSAAPMHEHATPSRPSGWGR